MPEYGTAEISGGVERFIVANGYLDEWADDADPKKLSIADGAGILASATYPVVTVSAYE